MAGDQNLKVRDMTDVQDFHTTTAATTTASAAKPAKLTTSIRRMVVREGGLATFINYLETVCRSVADVHAAAELAGYFYSYGHHEFLDAKSFANTIFTDQSPENNHPWDLWRLNAAREWEDRMFDERKG
jgi:hypothetical protein